MEKVRRKIADNNGERKIRTVWMCRCKIGTTNGTVAYFFDKPQTGILTTCVREADLTGYKTTRVYIDEVRDDDFVFCSLM